MKKKDRPNIVICSAEKEATTDLVVKYLVHFNKKHISRISDNDFIDKLTIELSNSKDSIKLGFIDRPNVDFNNSTKYWYRRADFSVILADNYSDVDEGRLQKYIQGEWDILKKYIHDSRDSLGNFYKERDSNKLVDLNIAKSVGFNIPYTLITSEKSKLLEVVKKYKTIITKPIHNSHLVFNYMDSIYSGKGVVRMTMDDVLNIGERFSFSLFQEYVEKTYEIRVFFYGDKLFPMAIFSQNDEKTKFDYRNYNRIKPNRNVPIRLKQSDEKKIRDFISKSNLTTGSIDIIYNKERGLFFLEVNPAGQFGWVSANCNYYIEKKIALHLTEANEN
jgi:hypothetical protein